MFAVETESGIQTILQLWETRQVRISAQHHFQPRVDKLVTLYVPHLSSWRDVAEGQVPSKPRQLWTLDVRGLGMSLAMTANNPNFFAPYGSDYMYAAHGQMLRESYLGRRVHDLLSTLDLLRDQGTERVHLIGRGLGALLATYAACLHPLVKQVTLKNTLLSYREIAQASASIWPLSILPWAGLKWFELSDCYRLLRKKKHLRIVDPWNVHMRQ